LTLVCDVEVAEELILHGRLGEAGKLLSFLNKKVNEVKSSPYTEREEN
jgi:hypothetical protein